MSSETENLPTRHTPPLGYDFLTPLYDNIIAWFTREKVWRTALINEINPEPGDTILDVGCGTGSLALVLICCEPRIAFLGIDPDSGAIIRARRKLQHARASTDFIEGFLDLGALKNFEVPNKIVSSLVLHQVPLSEKRRILRTMYELLPSGGRCLIADYGLQRTWSERWKFRMTVQLLDGLEHTTPNAQGVLPELMSNVGFQEVIEDQRIKTLTGTISIYQGVKS